MADVIVQDHVLQAATAMRLAARPPVLAMLAEDLIFGAPGAYLLTSAVAR